MSLQTFFNNTQNVSDLISKNESSSFSLDISVEDYKHLRALRIKTGEHIGVVDCTGTYYNCEVESFNPSTLNIKNSQHVGVKKSKHNISLFVGLLKGTKLDDVVRSCTEIGISEFTFVEFERCVVKLEKTKINNRIERYKKIAKSAAIQSGAVCIPKINDVIPVCDLYDDLKKFDETYLFWEEANKYVLDVLESCNKCTKNIAIVIGPEGGISPNEVENIKSHSNVEVVSLGRSILRATTACTVACGLVKTFYN